MVKGLADIIEHSESLSSAAKSIADMICLVQEVVAFRHVPQIPDCLPLTVISKFSKEQLTKFAYHWYVEPSFRRYMSSRPDLARRILDTECRAESKLDALAVLPEPSAEDIIT